MLGEVLGGGRVLSTSALYKEPGAPPPLLGKETLGKEMPCARRLKKDTALTVST